MKGPIIDNLLIQRIELASRIEKIDCEANYLGYSLIGNKVTPITDEIVLDRYVELVDVVTDLVRQLAKAEAVKQDFQIEHKHVLGDTDE